MLVLTTSRKKRTDFVCFRDVPDTTRCGSMFSLSINGGVQIGRIAPNESKGPMLKSGRHPPIRSG